MARAARTGAVRGAAVGNEVRVLSASVTHPSGSDPTVPSRTSQPQVLSHAAKRSQHQNYRLTSRRHAAHKREARTPPPGRNREGTAGLQGDCRLEKPHKATYDGLPLTSGSAGRAGRVGRSLKCNGARRGGVFGQAGTVPVTMKVNIIAMNWSRASASSSGRHQWAMSAA